MLDVEGDKVGRDRIGEQSRLRFFADAYLLSTLCRPPALKRLSDILTKSQIHGKWWSTHVLRGYKLVAETALYGLLGRIIINPDFLNMKEDARLSHWWAFVQGDYRTSLSAAISNESSQLGQTAFRIDHILTRLRQSVTPWERFHDAAKEAGMFADILSEVGLSCIVTTTDSVGTISDVQSLLKDSAIERLHDYVDGRELQSAYHYIHREGPKGQGRSQGNVGIGEPEEAETSHDPVPRYFGMTHMPDDLGVGVLTAVAISLHEFGFSAESLSFVDDALRNGINGPEALKLAEKVLGGAGALQYPSMSFGLKSPQEIAPETKHALGSSAVPHQAPEDRLRVLLSGSARLVGSQDYFDVRRFEVLVEGIASLLPEDSHIDVLRVVHRDHPGTTASVSIGVSMPVPPATWSDKSAWWVFYRVYDLDRFEPANRAPHEAFEEILRRFDKRIRLEEIPDVLAKELLDLIDKSALREENLRLRNEVHRLKDTDSDLRGAIPEMLSGLLLTKTGFRSVRTSHKVTFPGVGERELDAVGISSSDAGTECLIVEAKGSYDSQYDLMKQVKKLQEKIELARSNDQLVGQSLGYGGPISRFKGRFVSMADLSDVLDDRRENAERDNFGTFGLTEKVTEVREFLSELTDIEIWDYGIFKRRLRQAAMSEDYINLIERSVITWHLRSPDLSPTEI